MIVEKAWNSKLGRTVTRAEWEANHKPTCDHYPCWQWPEIHWHLKPADAERLTKPRPRKQRKTKQ